MNITVINQEHCARQVKLEIPGDTVRGKTDEVARQLATQVTVPGFRPGHVPKSVIKTRFSKEVREEVIRTLVPEALEKAITEKDLKMVGEPSMDELKFEDDGSLNVTIKIEVAPEFELQDYKNLELTKRVYKVSDKDVDDSVHEIRQRHAELVPVEDRGAETGDLLTINNSLLRSDEGAGAGGENAGAKSSETPLEIELGKNSEAMDAAFLGSRVGDTRTYSVSSPAKTDDDAAEGDEGQSAATHELRYSGEVVAVRTKELPEPDDEFAHTVAERFNTMDELRAEIKANLEHEAHHRTDDEFHGVAMKHLTDSNVFDVPSQAVDKHIEGKLKSLAAQFARQGIDLRKLNFDWQRLAERERPQAEVEVRGFYILDRIAEAENLEVPEELIDQELLGAVDGDVSKLPALKARLTKENTLDTLKTQILNRKALDVVTASAKVTVEEVDGGASAARDEAASGT